MDRFHCSDLGLGRSKGSGMRRGGCAGRGAQNKFQFGRYNAFNAFLDLVEWGADLPTLMMGWRRRQEVGHAMLRQAYWWESHLTVGRNPGRFG